MFTVVFVYELDFIYFFQKMNKAIFHGMCNRKCAELALPCDDNKDELAFSDRTL